MSNMIENLDKIKQDSIEFAPKIVISIIMLITFAIIADWIKNMISGKVSKHIDEENITLKQYYEKRSKKLFYQELGEIVYYLIISFGIIFAIINLGVQTATILTILGTFVVAIGLSIQGSITNVWAGLYISLSELYKIGDRIKINDKEGIVNTFSLFNTQLVDPMNNALMTIPNSMIQSNVLINYNALNNM